jgi:hypothetical protein
MFKYPLFFDLANLRHSSSDWGLQHARPVKDNVNSKMRKSYEKSQGLDYIIAILWHEQSLKMWKSLKRLSVQIPGE